MQRVTVGTLLSILDHLNNSNQRNLHEKNIFTPPPPPPTMQDGPVKGLGSLHRWHSRNSSIPCTSKPPKDGWTPPGCFSGFQTLTLPAGIRVNVFVVFCLNRNTSNLQTFHPKKLKIKHHWKHHVQSISYWACSTHASCTKHCPTGNPLCPGCRLMRRSGVVKCGASRA